MYGFYFKTILVKELWAEVQMKKKTYVDCHGKWKMAYPVHCPTVFIFVYEKIFTLFFKKLSFSKTKFSKRCLFPFHLDHIEV